MATSLPLPNYTSHDNYQMNSDLTSTGLGKFGARSNCTPYMHYTSFSTARNIVHKNVSVTTILSEKPLEFISQSNTYIEK